MSDSGKAAGGTRRGTGRGRPGALWATKEEPTRRPGPPIDPDTREGSRTDAEDMTITSLPEFRDQMGKLLSLELEADKGQNRILYEVHTLDEFCDAGVALKELRLRQHNIRLDTWRLLEFACASEEGHNPLPENKLKPGDRVKLCPSVDGGDAILSGGVVVKLLEDSITVAFSEYIGREGGENNEPDYDGDAFMATLEEIANGKVSLLKVPNDVTFERLQATLKALEDYKAHPGWVLAEYFFGDRPLPGIDHGRSSPTMFLNQDLNAPQRVAVDFSLNDRHPIAIVHGPTATGKTTVVVEIIRQLVKKQKKVLVCAPSNAAVDNVLKKLVDSCPSDEKASLRLVRLGHPARTDPSVQTYNLDMLVAESDVVKDIEYAIYSVKSQQYPRNAKRCRAKRRKQLRERLRNCQKAVKASILQNGHVIFGTLTSITRKLPIGECKFDVAVIDECSRATELSCWSALLAVSGEKCILAGDRRQLPPTILSKEAASGGFGRSLMERAVEELGDEIVQLLNVQYRMNDRVMRWPSDTTADDGRLEAGEGVGNRLLSSAVPY